MLFCCFYHKREQNAELNVEQINVLVSVDRESELSRSSAAYYNASVYFNDTTTDRNSLDSDECIVYELLCNIVDNIIDNDKKLQ